MSKYEKFDACKKDIRSLLISFQKGCNLPDFNRAYRELIGKRLPSKEFDFKTDIEFLSSMPDVVRVTPLGNNQYHLRGIADDSTKHIQNMVCKQKPSKLKVTQPPRSRSRIYVPPPRFSDSTPRLSWTATRNSETNSNAARKLTDITTSSRNNEASSNSARKLPEAKSVPSPKPSPKEEIVALVKCFKKGIALSDLLLEYEGMYYKTFLLEKYGFSSLEECLKSISELELVQTNNKTYVIHQSESSNIWANAVKKVQDTQKFSSSTKDLQNHAERSKVTGTADSSSMNFDYSRNQNNNTRSLPESMYKKFQKVAEKYSEGIWASDFPSCFEDVNNTPFELHSLGYNCLADCIDDYSDIFMRKHIAGSKKDYIIYPADEFTSDLKDYHVDTDVILPPVGALLIDHIILNIKRILEAYSEGIKLQEFVHVYSINCKDPLHVQDLGFGDLETFLISIKDRVPLKFESVYGVKTIFLLKLSDSPVELHNASAFVCQEEAIPFDAAFPDFQFKSISFPADFDYTKYFPVFVSSVAHPGHLYIQLNDEKTQDFMKFADEMEIFYNGESSSMYTMKSAHIKVGASCVALWPTDQHWYRAEILSIPSMDVVQVHYVDYGTRDSIPRSLLRYIRKEYTKLPAEALKCSLAFLKPANNASKWDSKARNRLLQMCEDIPLMAKIEEQMPDGIYSILLCDTNGEKDVYINDVLHDEQLADYIVDDTSNTTIPLSPESEQQTEYPNLHPLQALQAQCFLQAFATIAPCFAQNEHYLKLLQQVSMYCPNADSIMQSPNLPLNPVVGGLNNGGLFQPNVNLIPGADLSSVNPEAISLFNTNISNCSPIKRPKGNLLLSPENSSDTYLKAADLETYATKSILTPSVENKNCDSEIFEEDDDEMFQEFCQQVSSTKLRYVKRVMLGDGYKIHIIVVESKPYASSGDISQLIWNNKEADYLFRRLQLKDADVPSVTLSEDGNEELFYQLDRYNVKGVQKTSGFKASILLYPLKVIIKILNLFGHPSISLRTKLTEEIAVFNPSDAIWKEFSAPEALEPEEDENLTGVTDDDKIERLCLFDLMAMKEGIKCRRMKILNNFDNSAKSADEISKLEHMHNKVLHRIKEIKEICHLFA